MLNHSCIPGINPILIMVYDPFNIIVHFCLLDFVQGFCTYVFYVDQGCWPVILFIVQFWYQGNAGLIKWVWKYSFLLYFRRFLEGLLLILLLNVWKNSPVKLSCSGLLSVGLLLINDSISLLIINMSRFSISSWFSLGEVCVSGNLSIFPRVFNFGV